MLHNHNHLVHLVYMYIACIYMYMYMYMQRVGVPDMLMTKTYTGLRNVDHDADSYKSLHTFI